MIETTPSVFRNGAELLRDTWPSFLPTLPDLEVLDHVWVRGLEVDSNNGQVRASTAILLDTELSFDLPGLDAVSLVFAPGAGGAVFPLVLEIRPSFALRIADVPITLRFRADLLKPVRRVVDPEPGAPDRFEPIAEQPYLEVALARVSLAIDGDGNISLDTELAIDLPPAMIADTGVVVEARNVRLHLDGANPPAGKPAGWKGVEIDRAGLYLPGELAGIVGNLTLTDASIGNGGFSGTIQDTWTPPLQAELFGMRFELASVALGFRQNALTRSSLAGRMTLPFFDETVDVEVGFALNGAFTVRLASADGLLDLRKEGVLTLSLDSLGFELADGVFTTRLSGALTPEVGGLDWPTFQVDELAIDSQGNVHLEGGWLDLPSQYSLDFYGFRLEITKLGFGQGEDGGRWLGFSGGLKLVDGLSAGASVEGLRLSWYDNSPPRLSLEGVGVELVVPDVLRFQGAVSFRELPGNVRRFDGAIKLELLALDLVVDGQLVIGRDEDEDYTFFAIYLGVELPAGIPLWATGLGLYGMAGLFALSMEPNRADDERWYSVDGQNSWYHRGEPGVTDLATKWTNRRGSLGLGAGITLGTIADNGFTFSGKMLLVIVFPGPIVLLEGKANLLAERSSLDGEPLFRSLAVLDGRAGSFLFGLDARYRFGDGGELIDIRGGAEAYFNLSDASAWHLYIGEKEPRERRIRAEIIQLLQAEAYFMLDARQIAMGAWAGYAADWRFGPLRVVLESWVEGNAALSWKPLHLHGDYWLHGKVGLSAFGFGLGLGVDLRLAAEVHDPFHLLGAFHVEINLPWPLPDIEAGITLEWGPELDPPPLPAPLQEIAVEHLKATTSWPLTAGDGLLAPAPDRGDGFLAQPVPAANAAAAPPAHAPVVPLDCRPRITFGRSVHDDAGAGGTPQPITPAWERIGDPARNEGPVVVRYALAGLALHRWQTATQRWQPVARRGTPGLADDGVAAPELYGSWAPVPAMPDGGGVHVAQSKLWLWSKTPFDLTRHGGSGWDDWLDDRFADYPCVPPAPAQELCCTFEHLPPGGRLRSPWPCPDDPGFLFSWLAPEEQTVVRLDDPVDHRRMALCFPSGVFATGAPVRPNEITIELPQAAAQVRLLVVDEEGVEASAFDGQGRIYGPVRGGLPADPHVEINGQDLRRVTFRGDSTTYLLAVCLTIAPAASEVARRDEMSRHLQDEMARWSQEDNVLAPHTAYRLAVVTTVEARGEEVLAGYQRSETLTHFAYFRTAGPPGLTHLSLPAGAPSQEEIARRDEAGAFLTIDDLGAQGNGTLGSADSLDSIAAPWRPVLASALDDLVPYVRQTVPATVPAAGEKAPLPRPVYRAYDLGAAFNETYVDLLYRLAGRALGLYLYDNNDHPLRDAAGRLAVLPNRWGQSEALTLTRADRHTVRVINASDCAAITVHDMRRDETLALQPAGLTLAADTLHQARLVPLLLDEDFRALTVGSAASGPAGSLGRWRVHDQGNSGGPSRWEVREEGVPPSRLVAQTAAIQGGSPSAADPVKPGTLLLYGDDPALAPGHREQPGQWRDYRLQVRAEAADGFALGVVFRYLDDDHHYRFSLDRDGRYRRLVRVVGGVHTLLAKDDFVYRTGVQYTLVVEAVDSAIRVFQDGTPVFAVDDASLDRGRIGLYTWREGGARFRDVRVDDFHRTAPVVYRFAFTTSRFADLHHHLHSFDDETWSVEAAAADLDDASLNALVATAVDPDTAPTGDGPGDDEARAYAALAAVLTARDAGGQPLPATGGGDTKVRISRVLRGGQAVAFFVHGPEPIDWARTRLAVVHTPRRAPRPAVPGAVKLTAATFASGFPGEESVTLLLREALSLDGHRLEQRRLPGPLAAPDGDPVHFRDDFTGSPRGLLQRETFGPNALDAYTVIDEGTNLGPSAWSTANGDLLQTSSIYGGQLWWARPEKPGTVALTGDADAGDVRIRAALRTDADGALGLVFRYRDSDNYYRLSLHRYPRPQPGDVDLQRSCRRLVKRVGGVTTTLWQDEAVTELGRSYALTVEAHGEQLLVFLDGNLLCSVRDGDLVAGRLGFYSWNNPGARFEALQVETLEVPPVLWQPALTDLTTLTVTDAPGALQGPSQWAAANGVLVQTASIQVPGGPLFDGTYVVGGQSDWRDVAVAVRLLADAPGAVGVLLRHSDDDHYYRFTMDAQQGRRLIKKVAGVVTELWRDGTTFTPGRTQALTFEAVGGTLRATLDGVLLFDLEDGDLRQGRVGLYTWNNGSARFTDLVVVDRQRRLGPYTLHDDAGTQDGPSLWRRADGVLRQLSGIYGTVARPGGGGIADYRGTHAVAGDPSWRDYRLTAKLRVDQGNSIGLVFRYVDDDNFYRLFIDVYSPYRRLIRKQDGVATILWDDVGTRLVGESFTLTVDAIGDHLVAYLDDARLFDVHDAIHAAGRVGLYCWNARGARGERLEVRRPPLDAYALLRDRFAEGDMSAWQVVDEGTDSRPSAWTVEAGKGLLRQDSDIHSPPRDRDTLDKKGTQVVAGDATWEDVVLSARLRSVDDDAIGLLLRYTDVDNYYRFSMDSQRRYRRLVKDVGGVFTLLWEDAFAFEPNRAYEVTLAAVGGTLRGYWDGVPMFTVRDRDLDRGQVGLYCWENQAARFSQVRVYPATVLADSWLLDEPFTAPHPGPWTFVDDGDQDGPGVWERVGESLRQTSGLHGGDPNEPHLPGALALAGEADWADYALSVQLRADEDGGIGALFRYRDVEHYYRFSMDSQLGFRRLIKNVAGAVTTLWEDNESFDVGRDYVLTLAAVGDRIAGFLDGVPLFTVEDGDLASGRIGLYSWQNPGVSFAEVRVAAAVWAPYYDFTEDEKPLPAGQRVQVFAGDAISSLPPEPGAEARYQVALGTGGRINLPAAGADLRLVRPDGTPGHRRIILPAEAYDPHPMRVLRSADGTGFFLLRPDGAPLAPGQHRLRFTYHRDNRAADPESEVRSQGGDRTPERVEVEVPE